MLSRILTGGAGAAVARWTYPMPGGSAAPQDKAGGQTSAGGETAGASQLAELAQRAERQARESRQAGFREGEAAGRGQAAAQLQPVLEKLAQTITEITGLRPSLMRDAEADLVQLALGIARRILRRELSVDPGALEGLVKGALEKLPSQEICRIRVHPELESGLRAALARAGRGGVALVADATLERGAVLFETARGKLDASLESQLAEIGRGLADRIGER